MAIKKEDTKTKAVATQETSPQPLKRVIFGEKYRCVQCQSSNTYITKKFKVCRKCGLKEPRFKEQVK